MFCGETFGRQSKVPETCQDIWGKMDWGETIRLDVSDYNLSKTVVFKAYFTLNPLKNMGALNMPFKVYIRDATAEEIGGGAHTVAT